MTQPERGFALLDKPSPAYEALLVARPLATDRYSLRADALPSPLQSDEYIDRTTPLPGSSVFTDEGARKYFKNLRRQGRDGFWVGPTALHTIVDEGVVRRTAAIPGGAQHLATQLARHNVDFRIVPTSVGPWAGNFCSFDILRGPNLRPLVYYEGYPNDAGQPDRVSQNPEEVAHQLAVYRTCGEFALGVGESLAFVQQLAATAPELGK